MDQNKDNNGAKTPAEDKKENSGLSLETTPPTEERSSESGATPPKAPSKDLSLDKEVPSSGLSLDTPAPAPEKPSSPISLEDDTPIATPNAPKAPGISLENTPSKDVPKAPALETPKEDLQMGAPIKGTPAKDAPAKPMGTPAPKEPVMAAPTKPTTPMTPPVTNTPSKAEDLSAPKENVANEQAENIADDHDGLTNNPPPFERRRSGSTILLPAAALGVLALIAGGYFWMTSEPATPIPMVAADPFDKWPPQPTVSIQPENASSIGDTAPADIAELDAMGDIPTDIPTPIDALVDPENADLLAPLDDTLNTSSADLGNDFGSEVSEITPEISGLEADIPMDQVIVDPVTEEVIDGLPVPETSLDMEQAEINGDISDDLEIQETAEIIRPEVLSDDLTTSDNDFIELEENTDGSEIEESLSLSPTTNETAAVEVVNAGTKEPDLDVLISAEEALIANQDILNTLQPPPEADTQSAMLNGADAAQATTQLPAKAEPAKKIGTDAVIRPLPRGFLFVKKNHNAQTPDSRQVTAQLALSEHRYEAAYQLFDTLSAKKPKNEKALMGRAVSLHKLGRHNEAVNGYQKVLTRNSKNLEALSNMLGILRLENPQAIISKLEDLYKSYPTNDTIIAQLGVTYGDLKKYDLALGKLNLATSLAPNNPSHALNKAVILDHMKQPSKAAEAYQHALALDRQFSNGQPSLPTDMIKKRLTLLR